jgi:rhodanese-related sulfurtransferase
MANSGVQMKHSQAFEKLVAEVMPRIKEIRVEEVVKKQKSGESFTFFDVREDHEWQAGRAKGAVHLGKGIIERDIEKYCPDHESEIVLYCGGGYRSALAADNLQRMGYSKVHSMQGGFRAWKESALPIDAD